MRLYSKQCILKLQNIETSTRLIPENRVGVRALAPSLLGLAEPFSTPEGGGSVHKAF